MSKGYMGLRRGLSELFGGSVVGAWCFWGLRAFLVRHLWRLFMGDEGRLITRSLAQRKDALEAANHLGSTELCVHARATLQTSCALGALNREIDKARVN